MEDTIFVDGMIVNKPSDRVPVFVICRLGIKLADFAKFVKEHKDGEWMNIDILESRQGKYYAKLDNYKKTNPREESVPEADDDLPF